jgi:hypothetical protein
MACNNQHDSPPSIVWSCSKDVEENGDPTESRRNVDCLDGFARPKAASAAGISLGKRQVSGKRLTARNIGAIPSPHVSQSAEHFHETPDGAFHEETPGNEAMTRTRKRNIT